MQRTQLHENIFVINDFLTSQECKFYIQKGEKESFQEAKVNVDNKQVMLKGVRDNQRILFTDEVLAQDLWLKIKQFVPEFFGEYEAIGLNEMFRIYKYSEAQRFKMHIDGSYKRNENECSFYSLLIYLNDDYQGGETYFKEGITINPKQGNALFFHHPLKHEGRPILEGVKYILRTDIMFRK